MSRVFVLALICVSVRAIVNDEINSYAGPEDTQEESNEAPGPQFPGLVQEQPASPAAAPAPPQEPLQGIPTPATPLEAAKSARQAARAANKVAKHSKKVIGHAKKGLKHALHAVHEARVESTGLKKHQKKELKKAEAQLREATKKAEYGKLQKLQDGLDAKMQTSEKEQMKREIAELRQKLKEKNIDDPEIEKALDELEADVDKSDGTVDDESKAELQRLKQLVDSLEGESKKQEKATVAKIEEEATKVDKSEEATTGKVDQSADNGGDVTPVQEKGLDIDTQMPYGDLEPFGREDTAQELTESSVKESDSMVDQLERAEVAEEKRAVFRALTRLRGAAITSFDGVARSQTGNIDEYNKVHKWRSTHPLHHLADEESDVAKWAFPDNAD